MDFGDGLLGIKSTLLKQKIIDNKLKNNLYKLNI